MRAGRWYHRRRPKHGQITVGEPYSPSRQGKKTAVTALTIFLAGCGGGTSTTTTVTVTSTVEVTKTVAVTAPPSVAPKTTIETDGTYRVGIDIVPGTYRSAGASPQGESDCYWARLNSLNPTHIITNGLGTGPQVVTVQPNDTAFLTHSCLTWQKD